MENIEANDNIKMKLWKKLNGIESSDKLESEKEQIIDTEMEPT